MTAPVLVPAELLERLIRLGAEATVTEADSETVALARGLLAGAEVADLEADTNGDAVILSLTLAVERDPDLEATEAGRLAMARAAAERSGLDPTIVQQHPAGGLYVRLPRP